MSLDLPTAVCSLVIQFVFWISAIQCGSVDIEGIEKVVREVVDDMEVEEEVVGNVQQDETFWME